MEQSLFCRENAKELFPGSEIVNKRSFRTFNTRDESALLQTQTEDCFECPGRLSPQKSAA